MRPGPPHLNVFLRAKGLFGNTDLQLHAAGDSLARCPGRPGRRGATSALLGSPSMDSLHLTKQGLLRLDQAHGVGRAVRLPLSELWDSPW